MAASSSNLSREEVELYNDEVSDIVTCIQNTCCNSSDPKQRNQKLKSLLVELEEYTQPLIQEIDSLTFDEQHLILCRLARVLPEVIQKEVDAIRRRRNPENNKNDGTKSEILLDPKLRNPSILKQHTVGDSMSMRKKHKWRIDLNRRASITTLIRKGHHKKTKDDDGHVVMDRKLAPHLNTNTQIRALRRRVRLLSIDHSHNNEARTKKITKNNTSCTKNHSDLSESTKEDLSKILTRLGYQDLGELYRHSKPAQLFGEYINPEIRRKESEKAKSARVEMQLAQWRHNQIGEIKNGKKVQNTSKVRNQKNELSSNDDNIDEQPIARPAKRNNNAQKVMMMIGVEQVASETDMHAIMKASKKALKKL